jgi:hypothetical protein
MTSKTAPAPAPEYATIRRDGCWTHEWNINQKSNETESRRAIDEYYAREEHVFSPDQAYPHHHALIHSARRSASKLAMLSRSSVSATPSLPPAPSQEAEEAEFYACDDVDGTSSIPTPAVFAMPTTTTTTTHSLTALSGMIGSFAVSKHHLTALSGMTGLLVRRMLGHGGACRRHINGLPLAPFPFGDLHKTTKHTHAERMNQYIHSALAAEYIIGNRYFRNVVLARRAVLNLAASSSYTEFPVLAADAAPEVREEQRRRYEQDREGPVGMLKCDASKNLTACDITPESLEITKKELLMAYSANIDRLMAAIRQYRRGFVSLEEIRTDPEFVRLNIAFWRYLNQLMKMKTDFEIRDASAALKMPFRAVHPADYNTFRENKDAKRFVLISSLSEPAVLVPLMFRYDVARIFDNWRQSYVKYLNTARGTWVRLANDGSTASFLAFAAIEPGMVTDDYAPTIGCATDWHTITLKSCANYIPSRHPIFGALRVEHRRHIKRTAEVLNTMHENHAANFNKPNLGVPRAPHRFHPTYDSFGEIVDDVRDPDSIMTFGMKLRTVTRPNRGNE